MEKTKVAHERPKCTRYRCRLPVRPRRPRRPRFLRTGYLRNAASFLSFAGLYVAVNVVLFGVRVWQYADRALLEQMARGTGFCLNFDCAMVLMLVLRRMLTWLRSHRVGQLLPLEHHIYLHKMAGWSVFILSSAHTFFHMANFVNMSHRSGVTVQDYLFDTSMGIGWFAGSANITGIVLLVILTVMVICSHRAVRKSGYFEIFYWTHLLSVPIWVLLILHSPNFWKWFLVPGALFALEVACRISRMCSNRGRSIITSATLLPSEVVRLTVSRPPDFLFHPGDFCYVKIPTVAKYEWHPFTISSSPENTDQMTFHIRVVGEWTRSLHENVLDACLKAALFNQIALMRATVAAPPSAQVALPAPHRLAGAVATLPVHLRRLERLRLRVNSTSSTRGIIGADQESDCETPHGRDNAGFQSDADESTALTMVPMTAPAASSAVLTASSAVLTVSSAVLPTTSSAVLPTVSPPALPTVSSPALPTVSSPALPTVSSPALPTVSSPALPTTPSPAIPTASSAVLPTASSAVLPTASSAVLPAEPSSVPPTASSTVVPAASTNWTDHRQDTDDQRGSEDASNISVANAGIPCGDLVDATTQRQDCVDAAGTTEQEQGRVDTATRQRDCSGATQRRQQQQDRVGTVVQHQDRIEAVVQQQQDRIGTVVQQRDRVGAVVQEQDSTGMTAQDCDVSGAAVWEQDSTGMTAQDCDASGAAVWEQDSTGMTAQDYDASGAAVWEQGHAEVTSPPPREPGTGTGRAGAMKRKHKRSLQHGFADRLEWKILLDGPYGAPSTSIFHAQHAVLIGGGIGVTPFASVLHCIVDRYNAAHRPCPHCRVPTCLEMPSTMLKLKKVDFVWVNRDMRSFEWFLELLHELRESQQRNGSQLDSFLTMQLYKTSSMPIVGRVPLRNEVKQGRPDWDKVFSQIRHRRCGKVTVFYCGPPTLGNVIREKAAKYGFGFVKEMF